MIPFDKLGWAFHNFGYIIYPKYICKNLCDSLQTLPKEAKVLDVGAGTGVLSHFAKDCREDLKLYAIDPSLGMLKYCKEDISTFKGVAEELPFDNDSFDTLLMGEALHHFSDIDKSFQESVRVLKDKGKIFIYDFDPSYLIGKIIAKSEIFLGEAGNFFKPQDLIKILEKYGFEATLYQYKFRYVIVANLKNKA